MDTDKSIIYREISRNKRKRSKLASYAQELCSERKEQFGRARTFTVGMKKLIVEKLTKEQWSPQQIVWFSGFNNIPMVSHDRIYQFIRQDKMDDGM